MNVGESEEGKALTRREIRTRPLVCLEDACLATGKARNMRWSGTLRLQLYSDSELGRLERFTAIAVHSPAIRSGACRAGRLHGAPRLNRTICRCQTCQAQFSHSPITVSCKLSFELSGMPPIPWNKSRAAEGCPVPSLVMPSHADQIQCFGALFRLLSKALVTYRVLH